MNKYIRTENEIFKIDTNIYNQVFVVNSKGEWFEISYVEKDIIKQADTIEELCDMFIDEETKTIFHKCNGYLINWKTNMCYSLKPLSEKFSSVKGAIWSDKGLIYVAKMNEKGELELI